MSITPKAGTRNPAPDRDPRAFDGWHLTNRRARILGCDWRTGNGHVSDRERPFRRSTLCAQSQCYILHTAHVGPRGRHACPAGSRIFSESTGRRDQVPLRKAYLPSQAPAVHSASQRTRNRTQAAFQKSTFHLYRVGLPRYALLARVTDRTTSS